MTVKTTGNPPNNLRNLRQRSGRTKADIAASSNMTLSYYSKLEDSARPLRVEHLQALANTLEVGLAEIIYQETAPRLVGSIYGDGLARIKMALFHLHGGLTSPGDEGDEVVPVPPFSKPGIIALRVEGNAMASYASDNWLVYCDDNRKPADEMIGKLCMVQVADDLVPRMRRIFRGREYGKFDLVSPTNVIEENVPVTGVSELLWIKPEN